MDGRVIPPVKEGKSSIGVNGSFGAEDAGSEQIRSASDRSLAESFKCVRAGLEGKSVRGSHTSTDSGQEVPLPGGCPSRLFFLQITEIIEE